MGARVSMSKARWRREFFRAVDADEWPWPNYAGLTHSGKRRTRKLHRADPFRRFMVGWEIENRRGRVLTAAELRNAEALRVKMLGWLEQYR